MNKLLILLIIILSPPLYSEIYQIVNDDGGIEYTDQKPLKESVKFNNINTSPINILPPNTELKKPEQDDTLNGITYDEVPNATYKFFENGNIKYSYNVINGIRTGRVSDYYANGDLRQEIHSPSTLTKNLTLDTYPIEIIYLKVTRELKNKLYFEVKYKASKSITSQWHIFILASGFNVGGRSVDLKPGTHTENMFIIKNKNSPKKFATHSIRLMYSKKFSKKRADTLFEREYIKVWSDN